MEGGERVQLAELIVSVLEAGSEAKDTPGAVAVNVQVSVPATACAARELAPSKKRVQMRRTAPPDVSGCRHRRMVFSAEPRAPSLGGTRSPCGRELRFLHAQSYTRAPQDGEKFHTGGTSVGRSAMSWPHGPSRHPTAPRGQSPCRVASFVQRPYRDVEPK